MKKINKFNLIEENKCKLPCKCGWNITIGGIDNKDLLELKKWLKNYKKSPKLVKCLAQKRHNEK